jgi:WD40 repeat protein
MAKVFTWDTGNSAGELVGHTKRILSCAFKQTRPFRIATASEDMRTIFYQGPPFKLDHSNSTHTNFVNCLRYAPDGTKYISVGSDKKIQMYNGATGEPTADVHDAHAGGIYSVSFSPDSTKFATASADKTIKIWDANTLTHESTLTVSTDPQLGDMQASICWLRSGEILTLSLNGNINIFDLSAPAAPIRVIEAHQVSITAMCVDPNSPRLYTGSYDGVVCVRDLTSGWTQKMLGTDKKSICNAVHNGKLAGMVYTADEIVSIGWDDTLRFASAATNQYFDSISLNGQPTALAASPLAPGLIVVVTTQEIALYRGRTLLNTLRNHGYGGLCAALWGAEELAIGGDDNKTHIYTIGDNNFTPAGIIETRSPVTALSYSPLGDCLAIGDTGRQVEVYERGSWTVRIQGRWVFHTSKITALSWSPSGTYLASGSLDESIIIWTMAAPEKKTQFQFAHMGGVSGIAWSGEDQLVSTGNDQVVALWRV